MQSEAPLDKVLVVHMAAKVLGKLLLLLLFLLLLLVCVSWTITRQPQNSIFICRCTWQTDWHWQSTTFWEQSGRHRIRIRINPEIRVWIPDDFWLRFWPWWRFALSEHHFIDKLCISCADWYISICITYWISELLHWRHKDRNNYQFKVSINFHVSQVSCSKL